MNRKDKDLKMLDWLKSHPEVLEQLERMRELEEEDPELDTAELDLLELSRAISASSFERILQRKCDLASGEQLEQSGVRVHGKKN